MLKKFGTRSLQVWTNYAHFLYHTMVAPERGRALLAQASRTLDRRTYTSLVPKFATLEFRSPDGSPELGRTLFEGLLDTWPKKFDLWNHLLDLEMSVFAAEETKGKDGRADPAAVRDVFERGTRVKGLKAKRAKSWFQRWAKWEEENGDAKSRENVSTKAREWARAAELEKAPNQGDDGDL